MTDSHTLAHWQEASQRQGETIREQDARWDDVHRPRELHEWSETDGPVLWWKFPIDEPPYVGTPNDLGFTVEMHAHVGMVARGLVGGWPGYHTHWTPLPKIGRKALTS